MKVFPLSWVTSGRVAFRASVSLDSNIAQQLL
jgi:hypothetical protein